MAILLVSDAHLRGPDDPNQSALIDFLRAEPFDELVIVGDLFDIWFVPDGAVPIEGLPVLFELHRLVDSGVPVTWVAGNHDWLPGVEALGIVVADSWTRTVGGSRLIAVHGDEGADEGLPNRTFQRLLHSRAFRFGARTVGSRRLWALGGLASRLSRDHKPEDVFTVLAAQNRLADRLLKNADVVFVGHTHCPGVLPRPGGTLLNLGDWLEHRTFARIENGHVRLCRWTGAETVDLESGPPHRRPQHLRSGQVATDPVQ